MSLTLGTDRRRGPRVAVMAGLVVAAQVLGVTVLPALGLPGATPDLLLVVVVAVALARGPVGGATFGLLAGLFADLAPPAAGVLGATALAYCVAGAVGGRWRRPRGTPPMLALLALTVAVALATGVQMVLDGHPGGLSRLAVVVLQSCGYDLVVGAVLIPVVLKLDRRLAEAQP